MRYKTILAAKIEEEERNAVKQEKLKEKNGIEKENVTVKKRTTRHIFKGIFLGILTIIRFILCAVGVLALIDPTIRETLISSIQTILHQ